MRFGSKHLKASLLSSYDRKIKEVESDQILWSTFKELVIACVDQDADIALKEQLLNFVKSRDIRKILDLTASISDPTLYGSHVDFYKKAVVASFLKKYPFKNVPGIDPLLVGLQRFSKAEELCRSTNRRIKYFYHHESRLFKKKRDVARVLHLTRLKISRWLGDVDVANIGIKARHGPGGSIGVKRPGVMSYFKYSTLPYTATARCIPYFRAMLYADVNWYRALNGLGPFDEGPPSEDIETVLRRVCKVTDYNKVTFVPKTALTHRAIAVEPTLNIFFQLGIGTVLRDKLRRIGLDLDSCWARNKSLAQHASTSELDSEYDLATLDLSMASDTLSIELVRDLLPPDWFDLLDTFRSHYGSAEGEPKKWAKFSSMGNGFTFELETLIFYALSLASAEIAGQDPEHVSVFGDDIICPRQSVSILTKVLRHCGFRINLDKSFIDGPFRESCGGDYFQGWDVRPFYLKRKLEGLKDLIFLRNNLYLLIKKFEGFGLSAQRLRDSMNFIESRMPSVVTTHLLGPYFGPIDGTLYQPRDLAQKSHLVLWDRDIQQMRFPVIRQIAHRLKNPISSFCYLQFLEGTDKNGSYQPKSEVVVRDRWLSEEPSQGGSRSIVSFTGRTKSRYSSEIAHCREAWE